jgi:hypothetical protein
VAATVDVEQLLWTPGEKTLFLPTADEIGGNYLIHPDWVTREALRILKANLEMTGRMTRRYVESYDRLGAFRGDTVLVPQPVRFNARRDFFDFDAPLTMPTKAVVLDQQYAVEIEPPTAADTRHPARYIKKTLEPAMQHMAKKLDAARVDVFTDLALPEGAEQATVVTADHVSLRGLTAFDVVEHRMRMRLDVLGGSSRRRWRR